MGKKFRYTFKSKTYQWTDENVIIRDRVWQGDTYVAAACFWNIDVNKQKSIVYGLGMRIVENIKDFPRDFDTLKEAVFSSVKESGFLEGGLKSTRRKWDTCEKFFSHTRFTRALNRLRVDLYALADHEKAASAVSNETRYIEPKTPDVPDTVSTGEQDQDGLGNAGKIFLLGVAAAILIVLFKKKR